MTLIAKKALKDMKKLEWFAKNNKGRFRKHQQKRDEYRRNARALALYSKTFELVVDKSLDIIIIVSMCFA